MKNKQEILKKICEKTGDNFGHVNRMLFSLAPNEDDTWLLGFLKSKDTMVAVFDRDEYKISTYGYDGSERRKVVSKSEMQELEKKNIFFYKEEKLTWQYHNSQTAGFTAIECLEYMEKYL